MLTIQFRITATQSPIGHSETPTEVKLEPVGLGSDDRGYTYPWFPGTTITLATDNAELVNELRLGTVVHVTFSSG